MSVGLKEAQPETKDRAAKEKLVELEVYVARKSTEIIQCSPELLDKLTALEGEEHAFSVTYTPWAVGNKVGISFKLVKILSEEILDLAV